MTNNITVKCCLLKVICVCWSSWIFSFKLFFFVDLLYSLRTCQSMSCDFTKVQKIFFQSEAFVNKITIVFHSHLQINSLSVKLKHSIGFPVLFVFIWANVIKQTFCNAINPSLFRFKSRVSWKQTIQTLGFRIKWSVINPYLFSMMESFESRMLLFCDSKCVELLYVSVKQTLCPI